MNWSILKYAIKDDNHRGFKEKYFLINSLFAIVLLLLLILPVFVSQSYFPILDHPKCFVKQNTGKPCPTCGITRSIEALYSGEIATSRLYHPYGLVIIATLLLQLFLRVLLIIKRAGKAYMIADLSVYAFILYGYWYLFSK